MTDDQPEGASRRTVLFGAAATAATMANAKAAAALITKDQNAAPKPGKIPIAFVMDEAADIIDFAGPWEVFQDSGRYRIYTVAPKIMIYNTTGNVEMVNGKHQMTGMKFIPDYSFDEAPQPEVIVIGAQAEFDGPAKLAWLRKAAAGADVVLGVCTGNFVVAHAGLLDGMRATTHHGWFDKFEKRFPNVQLVRTERVIDNGKIVSAGGLSSSIDGALHVIRKRHGMEAAENTAKVMEYRSTDWKM